MKKTRIPALVIAIATFSSCQFNQSAVKDLTTGAYYRGNGIDVEDITIEVNGKADNRNEFVFGEKVNLVFNNISGLTTSNGKTFPKLSIHIVSNAKDTVLSEPNLLKSFKNGTELSPLQLQAYFRTALPNQNNEQYKVFVEITDKIGNGTFKYELPFTIVENDLLEINSNGIEYSEIYLWNETLKQPVFDDNISSEHLLMLILNDIEGLELINEKVFPIFSLNVTDSNGNTIISDPNLLAAYEDVGVNPQDLKSQVTAQLSFNKGTIHNPCVITAILKDKYSSREVNISTELNIN